MSTVGACRARLLGERRQLDLDHKGKKEGAEGGVSGLRAAARLTGWRTSARGTGWARRGLSMSLEGAEPRGRLEARSVATLEESVASQSTLNRVEGRSPSHLLKYEPQNTQRKAKM